MVGCPHLCTPPVHLYSLPIHLYTPCMFIHPHGPPMLSVPLHGFGALHVVGGVFLLNVYWDTPPLFGGASPLITPPHSIVGSLYIVILRDISSYVGLSLLLKGLGVVPHHLGRFGGHISSSAVHMLILIHFF